MRDRPGLQEVHHRALRRISESRVAGCNTRHSRADSLLAIRQLIEGHPHYTFGIRGVERFGYEEVLEQVARITGCSGDPAETTGQGCIAPEATLTSLEEGVRRLREVARRGGRFVLGTGHPGSLLLYYIELGRLIEQWGGELVTVEQGAFVPPNLTLDYVERVAVLSDSCSIWHSHDPRPMAIILGAAGHVDLAVVDHGFAGGAVNAGIPTVAIMDTNDPALAVARAMGANVVTIPMDDNRPPHAYLPIVEVVRDLATLEEPATTPEAAERPGASALHRRLLEAERIVQERTGSQQALDEIITDFAETYTDQFLHTHFERDGEAGLLESPYVAIAIYKSLRNALDRFVLDWMAHRQPGLSPEEIHFYLEGPHHPAGAESRTSRPGGQSKGS